MPKTEFMGLFGFVGFELVAEDIVAAAKSLGRDLDVDQAQIILDAADKDDQTEFANAKLAEMIERQPQVPHSEDLL